MLYYKKILLQNRQFAKTRVSLKTVPPSFFGKVPGFQNDPAMESFEIKFFYNTTFGTAQTKKYLYIPLNGSSINHNSHIKIIILKNILQSNLIFSLYMSKNKISLIYLTNTFPILLSIKITPYSNQTIFNFF